MACLAPITAFYSDQLNPSGKRSLIFKGSEQQYGPAVTLPCGQCTPCRLEQARQWAMRCTHEASLHDDNMFLTLTYSNETIHPNHSLVPTDLQLFHKRLHNRLLRERGKGIRYYACGEYGDENQRPHYHSLIFGYAFPDLKRHKRTKSGEWVYTSEMLNELWPLGHANSGNVTFESASYVAGYIGKKLTGVLIMADRVPEFGVMSRRPGIGQAWFEKYAKQTYATDTVVFRQREMQPPKYYDKQLDRVDTTRFQEVKKQRQRNRARKPEDKSYNRYRQRAKYHKARLNLFKRKAEL